MSADTGEFGGVFATWSGPPAAGEPDISASLDVWVDFAVDIEEPALTLALASVAGERFFLGEAHALLMTGDATGAAAVLTPHLTAVPAPGGPPDWVAALASSAYAAQGDDHAMAWLRQSVALAEGQPWEGTLATLLGVAAEHRGDLQDADHAWLKAFRGGVATDAVRARVAASHVHDRGGEDSAALVRRLFEAVDVLLGARHHAPLDPRPFRAAAQLLCQRGDVAGARLLLQALVRCEDVAPELQSDLDALAPQPQSRRYRALVAGLLLASPLLLFTGLGAVLLVFLGVKGFHRFVPVPGFTPVESEVWRMLGALRRDPRTGLPFHGTPDSGWLGLALVLGGIVGVIVGGTLAGFVDPMSTWAMVSAWLVPTIAVPTLCVLAVRRWSRNRMDRARRRTYAEELERALGRVGACRCWDSTSWIDEVAVAYAERHLHSVDLAGSDPRTASALGSREQVLVCPSTRLPWLLAALTPEGATLLIRGAVAPQVPAEQQVGLYL